MIKRIINKIKKYRNERSGEDYIRYLKSKGIKIGKGTVVFDPKDISIDISRPELIEIGENVFLHKGVQIISHDWASYLFVKRYGDFIPAHDKVTLGSNIWLGRDVTILKGVTIGNNVLVGFGAVVTKDIPDNSVAVGSPAKVIMTLDEYYEKRKAQYVNETIRCAIAIFATGREPVAEDFYDDYPAFVDARNYKDYNFNYSRQFPEKSQFDTWLGIHKAPFNGFDEFLTHVRMVMDTRSQTD
ncbi:MAG: acyltransferase [Muribaculaceae bacterium]|nr:acyltransferase [Muribaculaceae bacterium]